MSCLIDGCTSTDLQPVRTFVELPGNAAKIKIKFEMCSDHHARFFREVESTGVAPSLGRPPATESEGVNLVRDIWAGLDADAKTMLGDQFFLRVKRFLQRHA